MPILNDRIVDQIDELLPEYINEEGQGLKKFLSAYFDFLENGVVMFRSFFLAEFMQDYDPVLSWQGMDIWYSHLCK